MQCFRRAYLFLYKKKRISRATQFIIHIQILGLYYAYVFRSVYLLRKLLTQSVYMFYLKGTTKFCILFGIASYCLVCDEFTFGKYL